MTECTNSIKPIQAKTFSIEPSLTKEISFNILSEDDQGAEHECIGNFKFLHRKKKTKLPWGERKFAK